MDRWKGESEEIDDITGDATGRKEGRKEETRKRRETFLITTLKLLRKRGNIKRTVVGAHSMPSRMYAVRTRTYVHVEQYCSTTIGGKVLILGWAGGRFG